MNITEANAVNRLIRHVLVNPPDDDTMREQAHDLAERAHKALHAGLTGKDVDARWAEARERIPVDLHAAISNAYYDARNAGRTMTDAANDAVRRVCVLLGVTR